VSTKLGQPQYLKRIHQLDEDQVHRLCTLLVLHLEADRTLSWRLHIAKYGGDPRKETSYLTEEQFTALSNKPFAMRLKMLWCDGLLNDAQYAALDVLNETRNALVHLGRGRSRLHIQESIVREEVFERISSGAMAALEEVAAPLDRLFYAIDS
jgi:hypothetical protein